MKIDAWINTPDRPGRGVLAGVGKRAREIEEAGYSGLMSAEANHDPFLPLALAAEQTEQIDLVTAIAVAFARNPMVLAHTAWDLQALSGGRFILGLGSQIRPHITKRYSMPWSRPAARMEEMIAAIRAIWQAWQTGDRLNFRGDFYRHTLMTPMFSPAALSTPRPKIMVAAVGPLMTRVAGRAADGFVSHAFQTASYLRDVTLPNLEAGLADSGRTRDDFQISMPVFTVTGFTEAEIAATAASARKQIAFYGSHPRIPRSARTSRLGRRPGRVEPPVQARPLGRHGRRDRRRDAQRVRDRHASRGAASARQAALRRHDRPPAVLRRGKTR